MYEVADFVADLLAGASVVLPWVGAGVAGGVVLMFAFMGIRKGLAFFTATALHGENTSKYIVDDNIDMYLYSVVPEYGHDDDVFMKNHIQTRMRLEYRELP